MTSNIIKFIVVIILAFCGYIFSQEDFNYPQKGNQTLEACMNGKNNKMNLALKTNDISGKYQIVTRIIRNINNFN